MVDVYIVDESGNLYRNGNEDYDHAPDTYVDAVSIGGSDKFSGIAVLTAEGDIYSGGLVRGYCAPIAISGAAMKMVGLEPYLLDGANGDVYRYFREGPGEGESRKIPEKSPSFNVESVDIDVVGPDEDGSDRTVYVLAENGDVFVDGEKREEIGPDVDISAGGISVEGEDVYVLDGSTGDVYKNGELKNELGADMEKECSDIDVLDGTVYVLTGDGDVYVNGTKTESFSSPITNNFVGILVKR